MPLFSSCRKRSIDNGRSKPSIRSRWESCKISVEESSTLMLNRINTLAQELAEYAISDENSVCTSGLSLYYNLLLLFSSAGRETCPSSDMILKLSLTPKTILAFQVVLDALGSDVLPAAAVFVRERKVDSVINDTIATTQRMLLRSTTQPLTTAAAVNMWSYKHTNGRIHEVLSEGLKPEERMLLLSTLCFKADWLDPFDTHLTVDQPFSLLSGATVLAPTMFKESTEALWESDVSMGFVKRFRDTKYDIRALFSLPKDEGKQGLLSAIKELSTAFPEEEASFVKMAISIPRFQITSSTDCNDLLTQLGLGSVFRDFQFVAMASSPTLAVNLVRQTVSVQVCEKGTEPTPFSAEGVVEETESPELRFDRPFAFALIGGETNTRLAVATVVNPLE
ncbi:Serpin (serine protease inhibitor) [Carpediemonas membranifera]|uniref:Serpin (Serine protease inhibitor) n=1 Tax=Carpediemonas membranifera TaxID=201153 RepID=A0A8J6B6V1_9EUKA|nr:Serpin (serine protease inhibitor) [Carpediemonas membranifera]|eukprot:KAG9396888.1 Serpin (serine protease inhibitor) [Carpediemonas membranifera]